jgi:hypothetical protein
MVNIHTMDQYLSPLRYLLSISVLTFIKWRLNTELLTNTHRNVVFSTKKADHRYRKLINYALTWARPTLFITYMKKKTNLVIFKAGKNFRSKIRSCYKTICPHGVPPGMFSMVIVEISTMSDENEWRSQCCFIC